jgi:hypothetical protein
MPRPLLVSLTFMLIGLACSQNSGETGGGTGGGTGTGKHWKKLICQQVLTAR